MHGVPGLPGGRWGAGTQPVLHLRRAPGAAGSGCHRHHEPVVL